MIGIAFFEPGFDRIARQTSPPLNFTDGEVVAMKHPTTFSNIDMECTQVLLLPKITAGYVDYLVNFRSVQHLLNNQYSTGANTTNLTETKKPVSSAFIRHT